MNPKAANDSFLDDDALAPGSARRRLKRSNRHAPHQGQQKAKFLADVAEHVDKVQVDMQQGFTPTFSPSEHERFWTLNYLEEFYNNAIITDVLRKDKGGKEANVYCCTAHPDTGLELIAAKLYRPRMFRNLRNDALYRQGRELVDEDGKISRARREALAIRKNTRFGKELRHTSWLENEYQTLQLLVDAGAHVPRPLTHGSNVILMEYVGDITSSAPTLNQVSLTRPEARRIFDQLVEDIAIMLACHRVHADLSAYNVLYWEGQFKIIDFPQAVDPRRNPDACALFVRDVARLCQYFTRYRVAPDPLALATDLWSRYELTNALDAQYERAKEELIEV
jgi:RIO kinase 1